MNPGKEGRGAGWELALLEMDAQVEKKLERNQMDGDQTMKIKFEKLRVRVTIIIPNLLTTVGLPEMNSWRVEAKTQWQVQKKRKKKKNTEAMEQGVIIVPS